MHNKNGAVYQPSNKKYLDSMKITSLIQKKIAVEKKIIEKSHSPSAYQSHHPRHSSYSCIFVKGKNINLQPEEPLVIDTINTLESAKDSDCHISISQRNTSLAKFSHSKLEVQSKRCHSANTRLQILKNNKKVQSPDKILSTVSALLGSRKNSQT